MSNLDKTDAQSLLLSIEQILNSESDTALDTLLDEKKITREQIYKIAMLDSEFASCVEDIRSALMSLNWRIWGDNSGEDEINLFYKHLSPLLPIFIDVAIISRLLGYGVAEYIYINLDGQLWIKNIINRSGELSDFEPVPQGLKYSPEEALLDTQLKYLFMLNRADSINQKGDVLALRAYDAIYLKNQIITPYYKQFLKRAGQPFLVYQAENSTKEKRELNLKAVHSLVYGGATTIGLEDKLQMLSLNNNSDDFIRAYQLVNAQIQKLILGRAKVAELENGSRSAQETDDKNRIERISAYANLMQEAVQHGINAIIQANILYGKKFSTENIYFEIEKPKSLNLELAQRDQILYELGVRFNAEYFSDIYGFEEKHFNMELLESASAENKNKKSAKKLAWSENIEPTKNAQSILNVLSQCQDYSQFEKALNNLELEDNEQLIKHLNIALNGDYEAGFYGEHHD